MINILQQIVEKFISEVTGFFGQDKVLTLEEIQTTLTPISQNFVLDMTKAYLELLDQAIVEDKKGRTKKGFVIERRDDKRDVYLQFGHLSFKRTYFFNKRDEDYAYLLDQAVGLEGYNRVSNTVAVQLVEHASESSYGESSRHITGGEISRQTVMNKLRRLENLTIPAPSVKRKAKVLYINADEDHVSLQDGKKAMVPLISIHEGIKRRGKRGQCINPHYISSHGKPIEELWLDAARYIHDTYEEDEIEVIYLFGDGHFWIKEGLKWLPKAKFVLDRYHLNKVILEVTSKQPEKRPSLHAALYSGDWQASAQLIQQLKQDAKDDSDKKRIHEFGRYVKNNWAGIAIYSREDCGGSCTEAHVSHILSKRLSSRPMGWSREGLRVMAELRAFKSSGGKIEPKHLKQTEPAYTLEKRLVGRVSREFKAVVREQFNNVTILRHGKVVPAFECLRGLQNGHFPF